MIQPNTNNSADLFSAANTRAGTGFAAGQSGTSTGQPGDFGAFKSKLSAASSFANHGSRHRQGFADGKDAETPLSKASRAATMTKPKRKDGPLHADLKRATDGKGLPVQRDNLQEPSARLKIATPAVRQGVHPHANGGGDKTGEAGATRDHSDSPSQPGDSLSDSFNKETIEKSTHGRANDGSQSVLKTGPHLDQEHDVDDKCRRQSDQNVCAVQAGASAGQKAQQRESFLGNPNSKVDRDTDPDGASGANTAVAESDGDADTHSGPSSASPSTSGEPSGSHPGKLSSAPYANKSTPATTINRLNQQLLTADPRRMLLGLDTLNTLGCRMMMSAANVIPGDGTGGSVSNPTAAARVAASAVGALGSQRVSGSSPLGGDGGPSSLPETRSYGSTGIASANAADTAPAATDTGADTASDTNSAHNFDPASSAGQLPSANAVATTAAGTRDAAIESADAHSRSASAAANASALAKLAVAAAHIKQTGKQAGEPAASARANSDETTAENDRQAENAQAASAIAAAGNGGQSGQPGNHLNSGSGGNSAGNAAGNDGQPLPSEQQQASRALAQQVERAVASASRQAERLGAASGPITLRLKPESLGQVRIKLSVVSGAGEAGKGLGVKIEVGSTDAQRLLSESLGSLRDAMKAKGLVLEQSAVTVDPSLAPGTPREAGQSIATCKQAEAERADATRQALHNKHDQLDQHGQPRGGGALGQSGSDSGTNDHGRGRQSQRSARGGFFDGALLVPGGQRVTRTAA